MQPVEMTPEIRQAIVDFYPRRSLRRLGKIIGVSQRPLVRWIQQLGADGALKIRPPGKGRDSVRNDTLDWVAIAEEWDRGLSAAKLADKYGMSRVGMHNRLTNLRRVGAVKRFGNYLNPERVILEANVMRMWPRLSMGQIAFKLNSRRGIIAGIIRRKSGHDGKAKSKKLGVDELNVQAGARGGHAALSGAELERI